MSTLLQDLKYGLRMLVKNPGFTAVAVLTLALGMGANTAIFSLIDAVLLKMLPVQNPQQLVLLNWASHDFPQGVMEGLSGNMERDHSGRMTSTSFSYPFYEQIRDRNQVFSSVMALGGNGTKVTVAYDGEPGRADGQLASGTLFSTLGVDPILGRAIGPDDDRIGASPAAVISYGYWERRFGRDGGIVGRKITVNKVPFTIVGVTPPEFYGIQPGRAVEVWLPLHTQPQVEPQWTPPHASSLLEARKNWWVVIMGRLKPGVSEQQARAELEGILQQTIASDAEPPRRAQNLPHLGMESASKGLAYLRRQFSKPLFILMTVVGLVLLIACANVANLLLVRAKSRQKEIAVRLALGAPRGRLVRQVLTESVLLAGLGGAVGLVLAFWATDLLVAFMASGRVPVSLNVAPDARVLGFTVAVSVLTGILFGLSPALRSRRVDLAPALKESVGDMAAGIPRHRRLRMSLGRALVVTQVALSLLLLVGAGLFVRTLTNLQNIHSGFNHRNLLLFAVDPTQEGYKGQRLGDFYEELRRRLELLPGVRSATLSGTTLIGGGVTITGVSFPGAMANPSGKDDFFQAHRMVAGPRFFETMGIPLMMGRTISERDTATAPKVAVLNKQFVRKFLTNENPIGLRFGSDDKSTGEFEIVGVVADAKYSGLREEAPATYYLSYLQLIENMGPMHFEVRTEGNPMDLARIVRRVVQEMEPKLAVYDIRSQTDQINQTLFQERLFARLTSFFATLATLLACVGLYGLIGYTVIRRTNEIGIRMALGAGRMRVLWMVLSESLFLITAGIALGVPAALAATRLISSQLYGVKPTDPLTFIFVSLLLTAVALLACYFPARRATKVDPMVALRYE